MLLPLVFPPCIALDACTAANPKFCSHHVTSWLKNGLHQFPTLSISSTSPLLCWPPLLAVQVCLDSFPFKTKQNKKQTTTEIKPSLDISLNSSYHLCFFYFSEKLLKSAVYSLPSASVTRNCSYENSNVFL